MSHGPYTGGAYTVILVHVMSPWIVPLKIIMYVNPYGIQLGKSNSLDKSCGIYLRLSRVAFMAVLSLY